jgi:TPR repeat protein
LYLAGKGYEKATGVPKDMKQAARLYKCAAKLEYPFGRFHYGCCLESGQGVSRNLQRAVECFNSLSSLGQMTKDRADRGYAYAESGYAYYLEHRN